MIILILCSIAVMVVAFWLFLSRNWRQYKEDMFGVDYPEDDEND